MKVFSLMGVFQYEGSELLGVFDSLDSMNEFVDRERKAYAVADRGTYRGLRGTDMRMGYDYLGYVTSEFGQKVDQNEMIEYLD